eukprot:scaffold1141_cov369-Prasinococcus_capsulatus_cf.AAC.4
MLRRAEARPAACLRGRGVLRSPHQAQHEAALCGSCLRDAGLAHARSGHVRYTVRREDVSSELGTQSGAS